VIIIILFILKKVLPPKNNYRLSFPLWPLDGGDAQVHAQLARRGSARSGWRHPGDVQARGGALVRAPAERPPGLLPRLLRDGAPPGLWVYSTLSVLAPVLVPALAPGWPDAQQCHIIIIHIEFYWFLFYSIVIFSMLYCNQGSGSMLLVTLPWPLAGPMLSNVT